MVERLGLKFPVLYGLEPEETARTIGCSISLEAPVRLEPTGIVVRPDGTIAWSAYASSAIGRLTAPDTIHVMEAYQEHGY